MMIMMNLLLMPVIHQLHLQIQVQIRKNHSITTMILGLAQEVLAILPLHPEVVVVVLVVNHQRLVAIVIVLAGTMIVTIESLICNKMIHTNHFYSI